MPTAEEVRAHIDRITSSPQFLRSRKLAAFLRFAVEESLEGRGDSLKEYRIATAVFGRGETFDPRLDPIVRVQAGKLRARLAEYYARQGAGDGVRIDIPVGGYTPVVCDRPAPSQRVAALARSSPTRLAAALGAASLVAAALAWVGWRVDRPPARPRLIQLTYDYGWTSDPAVSRDGRWIAYSSDRAGADRDIWIQATEGDSTPKRLTTHPAFDITPDFSLTASGSCFARSVTEAAST